MTSAMRLGRTTAVRVTVVACAVMLLATACTDSSSTDLIYEVEATAATPVTLATPTVAPTATAVPEAAASPTSTAMPDTEPTTALGPELTVVDEEFLTAIADQFQPEDGAVLYASIDANGNPASASRGTDAAGNAPTVTDPFRVGSITKTFTAVAILTLVDQGLVELDTPAIDYVSRIPVPADVSVRDLLRNTSGIVSYNNIPELVEAALADPTRVATPEELIAAASGSRAFEPGTRFEYSNTNYVILGVLLEDMTGQRYHEVIRDRIVDRLGLSAATYVFGAEDGPEPFDPPNPDPYLLALSATHWAGGALVSSPTDLHTFFTALFNDQIVSKELVAQMTEGSRYGLGFQLSDAGAGLYGHSGLLPGYRTEVRHSPEVGVTAFIASTDAAAASDLGLSPMLRGFFGLTPAQ